MLKIVVGFFLVVFSTVAWAAAPHSALTPDEQTFLAAEKALAQGNMAEFNTLKHQLRDYPLYPYLQFEAITQSISKSSPQEVHQFLADYPGTPLAKELRSEWILEMARQDRWSEVVQTYQSSLKNTRLQCFYLQGLIETNQSTRAFQQVPALWLSGSPQPSSCDPVFKSWRAAGHLTSSLTEKRIRLALQKNQLGLAKQLVTYLSPAQQKVAALWLDVYQNPALITNPKFIAKAGVARKPLLAFGFVQYAKSNPDKALPTWPVFVDKYHLDHQLQQKVIRAVALNLARQGNPAAVAWLKQIEPAYATTLTREWMVRASLANQNWAMVEYGLQRLPATEKTLPIWEYWKARALEATGQPAQAKIIYQRLAAAQTFYGFLSQYQLGEDIKVTEDSLVVSPARVGAVARVPGIQRAVELWKLKRYSDARREWIAAVANFTPQQLDAAAVLAKQLQWYDRSIKAADRAGRLKDLDVAFPMAYKQTVLTVSKEEDLDPAWVFAIIRQESAFMMDVSSYVGALGLMQLMPATAREVAGSLAVSYAGDFMVLNPETNIRFGAHYIKKMYSKFDSLTVATASYNAGPGAATKWLPKTSPEPADIWIETIPYRETRGYVKNVMTFSLIYAAQLGQESEIKGWMSPIEPAH